MAPTDMEKEDINDLIKEGNELCISGKLEEGINCYAEAARLDADNAILNNNWGYALLCLARIRQDESLFRESFEKYEKTAKIQPDNAEVLSNWGNALSNLAKIRQDESLFRESFEKYKKATEINPDHADALGNWGNALSDLAQIKQDEALFRESIEKHKQAVKIQPNNADVFYNWGTVLLCLAQIKRDEALFRETIGKYRKATEINPDHASAFNNWGTVLSYLARIKWDESLYREAIEKYRKATEINPDHADAFGNWGTALCDIARIKWDDSFFRESFEKYEKATEIEPSDAETFNNWGIALYHLARIGEDDKFLKESFERFYEKSDCFRKLNKYILEILVHFGNEKMKKIVGVEKFYPLLSTRTNDGQFFEEATKTIKDILEKEEQKKREYQKAYILSIFIISQLHVDNDNGYERSVATYRDKTASQKILFDDSRFRLNAINYSNDSTEGRILFDYLFDEEKRPANESLNREYGAFAGCFIFNHDSLNQFRLYGKEEGKEGTGLSLVFRDSFFSEEAKMSTTQKKTRSGINDEKEEKHSLFRCVYIDPVTRRVETVGHKEEYLFYREKKELEAKGEAVEDIEEKWDGYHKYINGIIVNVRKEMEELKGLVKHLEPTIVGQLLINLRYLTKHIAFKEEQECRIVKIYHLNDKKIKPSEDYKQMYVEYEPKVSNYVEKIYFGPKADGMELFQDMLVHKGLTIPCEKSKNPLA